MIIMSEVTGEKYSTVEDCLEAERLFIKAQKEKEEQERRLAEERTRQAEEEAKAKKAYDDKSVELCAQLKDAWAALLEHLDRGGFEDLDAPETMALIFCEVILDGIL